MLSIANKQSNYAASQPVSIRQNPHNNNGSLLARLTVALAGWLAGRLVGWFVCEKNIVVQSYRSSALPCRISSSTKKGIINNDMAYAIHMKLSEIFTLAKFIVRSRPDTLPNDEK